MGVTGAVEGAGVDSRPWNVRFEPDGAEAMAICRWNASSSLRKGTVELTVGRMLSSLGSLPLLPLPRP